LSRPAPQTPSSSIQEGGAGFRPVAEHHNRPRVAIVGVGNILMGDDGVGIRVVEALQKHALPDNVELHDAGTAFQDLLPDLAECELVVIVDAVRTGDAPGTIHRFDLGSEDIGSDGTALSVHDINVVAAMRLQMVAGEPLPPTRVLGVEPGEVALKLDLSDEVRARVPEIADLAVREARAVAVGTQAGGRT